MLTITKAAPINHETFMIMPYLRLNLIYLSFFSSVYIYIYLSFFLIRRQIFVMTSEPSREKTPQRSSDPKKMSSKLLGSLIKTLIYMYNIIKMIGLDKQDGNKFLELQGMILLCVLTTLFMSTVQYSKIMPIRGLL